MRGRNRRLQSRRSAYLYRAVAEVESLERRRLLAQSVWAYPGADGHMLYQPLPLGDKIGDYSTAGYMDGMASIPNVPVMATVSPIAGDDTANIQAAIDAVSALPMDVNGFRGAVLLATGTYEIGTNLSITASGVVLRGSGQNNTILHATGTGEREIIQVNGSGTRTTVSGTTHTVTEKYVPVGAISFTVDSTAGLSVGDSIIVHRPSTQQWINDMGMNLLAEPWTPGSKDINAERTITHIDGNVITIDAPITQALDAKYTDASQGNNTIYKFTANGRLNNVGVEDIGGYSDYNPAVVDASGNFVDEDHPWTFIHMDGTTNGWVRNITSQYFGYSCVYVTGESRWVTVQDCQCLDPVSQITGGRRYSFNLDDSTDVLFRNDYAREGRHDFVEGSTVVGPNVFVDDHSDNTHDDTGPHHRYSTMALWDNVTTGKIDIQNRGNLGTGHGWAGANQVIWNSKANSFIIQQPPAANNWLIGSIGTIAQGTVYVGPHDSGIIDFSGPSGTGQNVTPRSLYYQQLAERQQYENFALREVRLGDADNYTAGDAADTPPVDAAFKSAVQAASGKTAVGFDTVANSQLIPFTFNFSLDPGTYVVGASLSLGVESAGNSTAGDTIYFEDASRRYTWSQLGVTAPGTTPGAVVIDLSKFLAALQDGKLNIAVSGNTAIDWATLNLQTASTTNPATTTITPVADAYVQDGTSANTNFGTQSSLQTKLDSTNNDRESYLKFDVSALAGYVVKATLRLVPTSVGYNNPNSFGSGIGAIFDQLSTVPDDSWTESGITWNNKPASDSLADEFISNANAPLNFDVTSLVQAALAGDKTLSFRLASISQSTTGQINFGSRENSDPTLRPQLIIQTFNGLTPVADAYTRSGSFANTNFGTATDLELKQDASQTSDFNRESFLKWNVSSIAGPVAGATVRLMPINLTANVPAAANWVTDDSWTENGVTWTNRPAPNTSLGSDILFQATPAKYDATAQVNASISTDDLFSMKLSSAAVSTGVNAFASREYGDQSLVPLLILKNLGPQITPIPDVSTQKDTAAGPFWFGIWDAETAANSLSVSATSSNTTLLPVGNIAFGGSGLNRMLTLTPAAGQTGNSTVTITVTDAQGATASTTFQFSAISITGIPATNNPDTIRIVRAGSLINLFINDMVNPAFQWDYATAPNIAVNALDGDDTITVDYTGGNPVPAAGLTIDGGADNDTLTTLGTSGVDPFILSSGGVAGLSGQTFAYLNTEELDLTTNGGADTLSATGNSAVTAGVLGVNITVGGSLMVNAGSTIPNVADVNVASGTTFILNGQNQTIDALNGSGTVADNSATAATLTVGQQNSNATFSGSINNGSGGGALSLTKIGSGKIVLSGTNSYTGLTTITAGVLESGNSASVVALPGTIFFNGGTLHVTADSTASNVANKFNSNTAIAGAGGTIDVDSGVTLTIGAAGGVASMRTNDGTLHGGTFTKAGAGTLRIRSDNSQLDDALKLNAGTIIAESAKALGGADNSANHIDMKNGTTLILRQDAATNFLTPINIVDASATVNVTVDALTAGYAGVVHSLNSISSVGAFTLNVSTGSSAGSGASGLTVGGVTMGGTGTYTINDGAASTTTFTVNGVLAGNFGFTKNGLATMVLASNNTYTGTTTVDMGILRVTNNGGLGATTAGTTINGGTSTGRVELDGNITVAEPFTLANRSGGINFSPHITNGSGTNTLTGNFTLNSGGSYWTLQSDAGTLVLSGNLTNANTTNTRTLYLRGAGAAQITGQILQTNVSLTQVDKEDAGAWTVSGNAAYTGPTIVNGGTLAFATNLLGSSAINITGTGSTVQMTSLGTRVLMTPSLSITAGGKLDLEDNKLIVTTSGQTGSWNGTTYTGITGLVKAGRNGGTWDGSGIVTHMPGALSGNLTTLAVAKVGDVRSGVADAATTNFAGQIVHGSDTIVMYTWGGDANLDGKLNIDDYTRIDNGIAGSLKLFSNGDFNYDGKINIDDYTIIDGNIGTQGSPFST